MVSATLDNTGASHHDSTKYIIRNKLNTQHGVITTDINPKKQTIKATKTIPQLGKVVCSVLNFNFVDISLARRLFKHQGHTFQLAAAVGGNMDKGWYNDELFEKCVSVNYSYAGVSSASSSVALTDGNNPVTAKVSWNRPFKFASCPEVGVVVKAATKGTLETHQSTSLQSENLLENIAAKLWCGSDYKAVTKYRNHTATLGYNVKQCEVEAAYVAMIQQKKCSAGIQCFIPVVNEPNRMAIFGSAFVGEGTVCSVKVHDTLKAVITVSRGCDIPLMGKESTSLSGIASVSASALVSDEVSALLGSDNTFGSSCKLGVKFDFTSDLSEYLTNIFG